MCHYQKLVIMSFTATETINDVAQLELIVENDSISKDDIDAVERRVEKLLDESSNKFVKLTAGLNTSGTFSEAKNAAQWVARSI